MGFSGISRNRFVRHQQGSRYALFRARRREHAPVGGMSTTRATYFLASVRTSGHTPTPPSDAASVREENLGSEESLPRVTPEMVEDWLRHAQLRAANLFYMAGDPSPEHRERALSEMTKALREALEEVRVVAEELRRETDVGLAKPRRDSNAPREQVISPPRHLERE